MKRYWSAILIATAFAGGLGAGLSPEKIAHGQGTDSVPADVTESLPASADTAGEPAISADDIPSALVDRAPSVDRDAVANPSASQPSGADDANGLEADEEFRAQLDDLTEDVLALYPYIADVSDPGLEQQLLDMKAALPQLSAEELEALKDAYSQHPAWWDFPQYLLSLYDPAVQTPPFFADLQKDPEPGSGLVGIDAVPTAQTTAVVPLPTRDPFPDPRPGPTLPSSGAPTRPGCLDFGSNATCDDCPPSIPTGTIRDIFIVEGLQLLAEQVDEGFDADIDFCVFPGVAFSVPNPIKAVTLGINYALKATVLGLQATYGLNCACEEGFHRNLVDFYLDATISSRLKQVTLDDHARLQLRMSIERNLLNQANDRISLFQLPMALPDGTPVCGAEDPSDFRYCGQLEFVRQIVDETITDNEAAQMRTDINNAQAELDAGDMHYMNQEWLEAYERYSKAYRFAVSPETVRFVNVDADEEVQR